MRNERTLSLSKRMMWIALPSTGSGSCLVRADAEPAEAEACASDYTPFDAKGGRGKMHQLFDNEMNIIIVELN
ncbi:MAG: hypothetical protein V2J62_00330, partial [candidate division KSB1 bacterium]|nr:hypothetical protein [candidate division KSB1 bacterium]